MRDIIAIDTETYHNPEAEGMCVFIKGTPTNEPFCVTVSDEKEDIFLTDWDTVRTLSEDDTTAKVGANLKYDIHMLLNKDIELKGDLHDVLIIHHLLNEEDVTETGARVRGLKAISDKYIGEGSSELEKKVADCRVELAKQRGCDKEQISYKDVYEEDPELMMAYALQDTRLTLELFHILYPRLAEEELLDVYANEIETMKTLVRVERNGMRTDIPYLEQLGKELDEEIFTITSEIVEKYGVFNINSANEFVEVLEGIGVDYIDKTESGEWDTSAKTLERIQNREGVTEEAKNLISLVLQHRELAKLRETYVDNLITYTQADGRVHPSFNQIGTVTGRMSCQNPNFHNFPKGDKRIRKAFIPEEGNRFYFLDFA